MNKAVFLDRDGTINVERNYLYRVEDFNYIPGVIIALHMLQDAGYQLVILTNQSGIARGYYSVEDYNRLTDWMLKDLESRGIHIAGTYYCPHLPEGIVKKFSMDCNCRKPQIGMFEKSIRDLNIDITQSIAIGDKLRDLEICRSHETRGFWLGEHDTVSEDSSDINSEFRGRITKAKDLLEAAKLIV